MTQSHSSLALRVRDLIGRGPGLPIASGRSGGRSPEADQVTIATDHDAWDRLAMDLFALQYTTVPAYRLLCDARGRTPANVTCWRQIPAVPTTAFQELEVTSIAAEARTRVFHSSGTTGQRPSRHFHHAESIALYEDSLRPWFAAHLLEPGPSFPAGTRPRCLVLTPPPPQAPNSSLVHMLEVVVRDHGAEGSTFTGRIGGDGAWELGTDRTFQALEAACTDGKPVLILGTAFLFVHLLDALAATRRSFNLPQGSRLMETGGYKGRSRSMARADLHAALAGRLGAPRIIPEYGMSELSSQAYDAGNGFRFPPWVRARTVHPETGLDTADGQTGILRIHDLANVWSVAVLETGDLARIRGDSFELLGRAADSEPRGCSRMTP